MKFQINSYFGSQGGIQYIKVFGDSVKGFSSKLIIPFPLFSFQFFPDKGCYNERKAGALGFEWTNPTTLVAKSHCDNQAFYTNKEMGLMLPFCHRDCSCCSRHGFSPGKMFGAAAYKTSKK